MAVKSKSKWVVGAKDLPDIIIPDYVPIGFASRLRSGKIVGLKEIPVVSEAIAEASAAMGAPTSGPVDLDAVRGHAPDYDAIIKQTGPTFIRSKGPAREKLVPVVMLHEDRDTLRVMCGVSMCSRSFVFYMMALSFIRMFVENPEKVALKFILPYRPTTQRWQDPDRMSTTMCRVTTTTNNALVEMAHGCGTSASWLCHNILRFWAANFRRAPRAALLATGLFVPDPRLHHGEDETE